MIILETLTQLNIDAFKSAAKNNGAVCPQCAQAVIDYANENDVDEATFNAAMSAAGKQVFGY